MEKTTLAQLSKKLRVLITINQSNVADHIQLQVIVIWLNVFTVSMTEAVEVHSLGDSTTIFVLCYSVRVKWWRTQTTSSETQHVFQEELFFTLEKVLAMQIMQEHQQTPHKLAFKCFCKIFNLNVQQTNFTFHSNCDFYELYRI